MAFSCQEKVQMWCMLRRANFNHICHFVWKTVLKNINWHQKPRSILSPKGICFPQSTRPKVPVSAVIFPRYFFLSRSRALASSALSRFFSRGDLIARDERRRRVNLWSIRNFWHFWHTEFKLQVRYPSNSGLICSGYWLFFCKLYYVRVCHRSTSIAQ